MKTSLLALLLSAAAVSAAFSAAFSAMNESDAHEALRERFEAKAREAIEQIDGAFGLVVKDLKTGYTFSVRPDMTLTQASVIKVPILVELFKQAAEGKLALDEVMTIEQSDFVGGAGILNALTPGKVSMPIRDIARFMIVLSDNTATNILIDLVGMENVNRTMDDLGLSQTRLQRKMMDSQARLENRENISTPAEAARLLELIHRREILDEESCAEILRILALPKRGRISRDLPGNVQVAHKTGSVGGVVNDIGIVLLKDRPFIIAAMASWNTDTQAAEDAIAQISLLAYHHFDRLENSNRYGHRK